MEKEVLEYCVVTGESAYDLVRKVNGLIKSGWVCQGGIAADPYRSYQAMIIYKD